MALAASPHRSRRRPSSRLSVRLVVDSYFDLFMPKATHPHVRIEHVARIPGRETSTLAGEWGLSLHLESRERRASAASTCSISASPRRSLNRNFDLLGIEPEKLDGLILSHSHRDHYGGLVGFVERYRAADARRPQALYRRRPDLPREMDRRARRRAAVSMGRARRRGAGRRACRDGVLRPCARARPAPFTSGPIARNSFEQRAAEHAGRADPGRSFHRGGAARPAGARQASRRARHLLCRAGARARRDLVLRPLPASSTRSRPRMAVSGRRQAARRDRRLSSRRRAAATTSSTRSPN